MKHIIPEFTFPADPHTVVENPDYSAVDRLYAGRRAYYGDYHTHTASGGTSDGKTTPEVWLEKMKELRIDFIGIMDHRQVRHMYLDCFDPEYFLYGTEPLGRWKEKDNPRLGCHYLMIFPERESLGRILYQFPDVFRFTGGIDHGFFLYIPMEFDRFLELRDAVLAEGGAFVNAHPKQQIMSDDLKYFNFGDGTALEIIYTASYKEQLNPHTIDNYKLWMDLLDAGVKMYNTSTADDHGAPDNSGINTVYSAEKYGPAYVRQLIRGDLNSGYVGIKMCIGDNPVGATIRYADDLTLQIKVDDVHPLLFDRDEAYRVDIITDRGLAFTAPLTLPFAASIKVEPRRFYRAEIIRERDGSPAAIGNPIWIE